MANQQPVHPHETPSSPARRRQRSSLLLILVLLVAFVLRFAALGQECLWADEFHSLPQVPTLRAALAAAHEQGVQYPYYVILFLFTRLAGLSEVAFRLPSALFGFLAVVVMAGFARILYLGRRAPVLLAAALLALSPMHVWYSQEARPYALQVLAELCALYALARALQRRENCGLRSRRPTGPSHLDCGLREELNSNPQLNNPQSAIRNPQSSAFWALASAVLVVLALEVHNFSIFIWAAFVLIYLWAFRPARLLGGPAACVLALVLLGGLVHPGLSILDRLGARSYLQGYLPRAYTPGVIIDVLRAQFLGPHWSPLPFWLQLPGIALGSFFLLRGTWCLFRQRRVNPLAFYLPVAGWIMTLAFPTAVSLLVKPIIFYGQRYLIIALPFTAALLAGNLAGPLPVVTSSGAAPAALRRAASNALAVLVGLFLALQSAYFPPYYAYRQKHLWDQAGAYLDRQRRPGETVYVIPDYDAGLLARYMRDGSGVVGLAADPAAVTRLIRAAKTTRVFVVSYNDLRPWLAGQGLTAPAQGALFETHQPGQTLWVIGYAPQNNL